ncbi:MAG: aspartate kinase [Anaerolineae bacterium]|nr:aspartate kinase [Anaerolineae bacterium]
MQVLKFGGTSVGNAQAFVQVAEIVQAARQQDADTVVVTSAMSGVTNQLFAAARAAATGDHDAYLRARDELLAKHQMVAGQLVTDGTERAALGRLLEERLQGFERLCRSIAILGELTARGLDVVAGMGERLAAPLLAAVLRARGLPAEAVDAADLIVTDNNFGAAEPLMEASRDKSRNKLLPLLARGILPVCTGYVGATVEGIPTTLGRGASDYSATILGACLDAREVQIWTDVDGILTADPRVVPQARTLPELSYGETAELAYFGAKVLHPNAVHPVIDKGISLRILNTFNPKHPGTRVVKDAHLTDGTVKAISAIKGLCMIAVEGRGMMGVPGIAARTFAAAARQKANVLMISQASSEQSICFVIPQGDRAKVVPALEAEFHAELTRRLVDQVSAMENIVIVAVVGYGMRGIPGIAAKVFGALGEAAINVIAVAQGSSEANISLVVAQGDADEAVRQIHTAFQLDKLPVTAGAPAR